MLLENELVEIVWAKRNKPIFINKGYDFTHIGDTFLVKQKDLSPTSRATVKVSCDYCGSIYETTMSLYTKSINKAFTNKSSCTNCVRKKIEEGFMNRYGVKTNLQLDSTKEKIKKTNLEKYGAENAFQNKEVQSKMKSTMLDRYGVEYSAQNNEIRNKQLDTSVQRYGVKYTLLNSEIKEKAMKTMFENKTVATSRTQEYLHNLLGGQLNYPVGNAYIDILLEGKIAFEYDGGGHTLQVKLGNQTKEEFDRKEQNRDFFLKRRGYKIIRLVSSQDMLPKEEILLESIDKCITYLKNGGTNSQINIDEGYIRFGKNINNVDFGKLLRTYAYC